MNTENTARTIRTIPAVMKIVGNQQTQRKKELVCAYARVSTDNEDQLNSYKTQCEYYENKLSQDPSIVYMGLYADEGITGTKMRKRKDFLRMLEDCRAGKITRIITKSVQRFARNTVECLNIARELADKGVTIKFETSGIDTADPGAWLMLGIMATVAEEESRTISHNITWAFQKKFEKGIYSGSGHIYGYNVKENFKIIEKEAMVVRRIFDEFLKGRTLNEIKRGLEQDEIPTPLNKKVWQVNTIEKMLTNEKYKGELLLQKTYKTDILCERKINDGGRPQYLVSGNHLPIINKADFDAVQEEIKRRREKADTKGIGTYTNGYAFSSMIECGECGEKFRRHAQWSPGYEKKTSIWVCKQHQHDHDSCSQKPIKEADLENGFVEAMQRLVSRRVDIIDKVRANINTVIETGEIDSISGLCESLESKQKELLKLSKKIEKPTPEEQEKSAALVGEIKDLQERIEMIKNKNDNVNIIQFRLKEIDKALNNSYNEFNKDICRTLVEKIIIKDKHNVTFVLKCGIAIDQAI